VRAKKPHLKTGADVDLQIYNNELGKNRKAIGWE
jgi:hypothetical protein